MQFGAEKLRIVATVSLSRPSPWALTPLQDERTTTMLPLNPCTESVGRGSAEINMHAFCSLLIFITLIYRNLKCHICSNVSMKPPILSVIFDSNVSMKPPITFTH